jgi:hypothetical protein
MPRTRHDQEKGIGPVVPMSEGAIREMISDWYGASRAYDGNWPVDGKWPWFDKHFDGMILHPDTRKRVLEILDEIN